MPLDPRQEQQLISAGDNLLHYNLADRGPFPIPHGSFYDTTAQVISSTTTAYAMTYNTTVESYEVWVGATPSMVYVGASGVYNIQFSCQLANTDSQAHDAEIWLAINGSNITESSTIIGIPSSHGGVDGHSVAAWNFLQRLNRNDYFQLVWRADSTQVSMPHRAATTSPTRPSVPSVILTVNLVSI